MFGLWLNIGGLKFHYYTYQHGNQGFFFKKKINSQIILSTVWNPSLIKDFQNLEPIFWLEKKGKKPFWCLLTINNVQALWFKFI